MYASHRPDLVLIDVDLGTGDALGLVGDLVNAESGVRILVACAISDNSYCERILRAGLLESAKSTS